MNARLKEIIFKKLYRDLSKVEIISYKEEIWFIDRETKYWYLIYGKSGTLYWRYNFFEKFFFMFSMYNRKYEPIISEWVEEVLNRKISTTGLSIPIPKNMVEEVLKCKINTSGFCIFNNYYKVEEVLNYKVNTAYCHFPRTTLQVEEVLNCKVNVTKPVIRTSECRVEKILNNSI